MQDSQTVLDTYVLVMDRLKRYGDYMNEVYQDIMNQEVLFLDTSDLLVLTKYKKRCALSLKVLF